MATVYELLNAIEHGTLYSEIALMRFVQQKYKNFNDYIEHKDMNFCCVSNQMEYDGFEFFFRLRIFRISRWNGKIN